ncbi:nitrate- and nitrite sensing domain-containing protein [Streptomyces sp. NPDC048182]|uniref:sensor histidine kinase n=1 Tax=Streptomyces sp. NPDC048182 TaxID=3365507 RepID=UPI00371CC297
MQGRFKRDGSASAEPEPQGGTGPRSGSSSPQHAQAAGQTPSGDGGDRAGRPGAGAGAPGAEEPPAPKPAKGSPGPGPRIALRNWRISTRLISLLALPVVAATSLGAIRINQSLDDIQQLDNMKLLTEMTKQATELAAALQEERDKSAGPLAHKSKTSAIAIKGDRDRTDRARKNFLDSSEAIDAASKEGNLVGVRDSLVGLAGDLNGLEKIRAGAYQAEDNSTQTVEAYHRLITHLLDLSQDMAEATSNPDMIQRTRALAAFSSAKEYASIQRAVIAAALPANTTSPGRLSDNDRLYAQSALQSQTSETRSFSSIYGDGAEDLLKPISEGNPTIEASDKYAARAIDSADGLSEVGKRSYQDWLDDSSTKIQQMKNIELTLLEDMEQKARELRSESEQEAIISGVLILLVLGVSLVGAFVVARSMIRSLRRLEETATKVAQDRLPELVKQLSETDPQDVDTSVESVGVHSRDEIGRVAAAFDDVHREAVRLAAEQALLRGNVNAMFTNLSRRSQGLIQRQLSLISELESREADPDQLSSLFKLDHLATRMRRNGENLLVLAGEEPGRRWTRPVPLVDVLRAAASEVEQYERIELASVPTTEVAGRVVNDLVHLLAELLENATSFSSPQTKVKVTGHALPDGRVLIEIHDTGIGLSPEDLAAINERLASPPTVDVSVSRRMGLFVVGRLSQRHGIRIQLRPSDSGGTTALVMLPVDVAQGGRKPQPKPGQPAVGTGGPAAAQAAAARRGGNGGQNGGALTGGPLGGGAFGAGGGQGGGLLGAGQGPRPALPGREAGGRPDAPGAPRGPQSPGAPTRQDRPAPAGAPQGLQAAGMNAPQGRTRGQAQGQAPGQDAFGGGRTPAPPQRGRQDGAGGNTAPGGRRPQLPPRGGARAELPGGGRPAPQPTQAQQPRVPSWSDENAQPSVGRASLDGPRGHEEPGGFAPRGDERHGPGSTSELPVVPRLGEPQGPAATSEFPRPDFGAPALGQDAAQGPGRYAPQQGNGSFVRSDVFGQAGQAGAPGQQGRQPQQNGQQGQPGRPGGPAHFGGAPGHPGLPGRQDPSATGQFERPQPAPASQPGPQYHGHSNGNGFAVPQQRPAHQEPAQAQRPDDNWALPPATGPGDGRTPLYDTLETNWFHGERRDRLRAEAQAPAPAQPRSDQPRPDQPQADHGSPARRTPAPQTPAAPEPPAGSGWRSSPNDDLVRQAERVRQPAAGGITTSGLPRRVPRANLVPGTAQQQEHQSGPQVSRAPDDVRGRLTNLRRGIAQGRQAGTNQTGSYPRPTHQQER